MPHKVDAIVTTTVQHDNQAFEKVTFTHASNPGTQVEVYKYGATITKWSILGEDLIFLSKKAVFQHGKGVRGGVPVVFPQFGPGKLPQHGFARTSEWTLLASTINKQSGDIHATFELQQNDETLKVWPHHFKLHYNIVLAATTLSLQLQVTNTNSNDEAFDFTALLHTYLNVSDIHKVSVKGLKGYTYKDKPDGGKEKKEEHDVIKPDGKEVDRVYIDGASNGNEITVSVAGENGDIVVKSSGGFSDYVVWNIGKEKAKEMSDMSDPQYVCVEAGKVAEPATLKAGDEWKAAVGFSLKLVQQQQQSSSHL